MPLNVLFRYIPFVKIMSTLCRFPQKLIEPAISVRSYNLYTYNFCKSINAISTTNGVEMKGEHISRLALSN